MSFREITSDPFSFAGWQFQFLEGMGENDQKLLQQLEELQMLIRSLGGTVVHQFQFKSSSLENINSNNNNNTLDSSTTQPYHQCLVISYIKSSTTPAINNNVNTTPTATTNTLNKFPPLITPQLVSSFATNSLPFVSLDWIIDCVLLRRILPPNIPPSSDTNSNNSQTQDNSGNDTSTLNNNYGIASLPQPIVPLKQFFRLLSARLERSLDWMEIPFYIDWEFVQSATSFFLTQNNSIDRLSGNYQKLL